VRRELGLKVGLREDIIDALGGVDGLVVSCFDGDVVGLTDVSIVGEVLGLREGIIDELGELDGVVEGCFEGLVDPSVVEEILALGELDGAVVGCLTPSVGFCDGA